MRPAYHADGGGPAVRGVLPSNNRNVYSNCFLRARYIHTLTRAGHKYVQYRCVGGVETLLLLSRTGSQRERWCSTRGSCLLMRGAAKCKHGRQLRELRGVARSAVSPPSSFKSMALASDVFWRSLARRTPPPPSPISWLAGAVTTRAHSAGEPFAPKSTSHSDFEF